MGKNKTSVRGVATVLGVAVAISAAAATFAQAQSYELSGRHVAIYNLVGQVNVQAARGSAVTVDVNFSGPDANELRVETGEIGDAQTLRVIYPDDQITYSEWGRRSRTELRVRPDGTFSDNDWRGRTRGDNVLISGRGGGLEAHADLTIAVPAGQKVSIYLAVGEAILENVAGDIRMDTHSAPVFVSGTRGTLTVDVGSGQVEVRGAEGEVNLDTGSGSIDVSDVTGSSLLIDTGSGAVTAVGVSVDDLRIDTGSGRITAERVSARDIILDTGSGSVELEVVENADNIEIDTGSGGVRVTVPASFGANVDIDTGSGGIELDMPITMRRWQRDHVQGVIGNGGGTLHIDTGSGSVRILSGR